MLMIRTGVSIHAQSDETLLFNAVCLSSDAVSLFLLWGSVWRLRLVLAF